ncbi:zinc-ribbon domain-containing protein [Candidatus Bathyarchaeota archaeon]|nr:zinc-ribbon domain-containing protein [Candidatus Bathyarchaeota archaeon]
MPLIEAVQWRDAAPDEFARRFPEVSLRLGSQLTVMENQWAVFFRDGKALDVFGPGRHTITSYNIPILIDIVQGLGIAGDIFECEVIFVNKSQIRSNFGGRAYSAPSGQIQYQAEIGFFGYLILKVTDPKLFVTEFFGNREASDSEDVARYIRGFVVERVIDSFGEYDIVNLVRKLDETTDSISAVINKDAERIGLHVVDSLFEGIDIPEEARRFASSMGQGAMTMQYAKETAEVLPDGGGGAAGAGLGAGIGFSFGQQMMNQQSQSPKPVTVCPSCGAQNPAGQKFCGTCGTDMQAINTVKCPSCGADVPKGNKFCGQCGSKISMITKCPNCGTENPSGNKFCKDCGTKL